MQQLYQHIVPVNQQRQNPPNTEHLMVMLIIIGYFAARITELYRINLQTHLSDLISSREICVYAMGV